MRGSSKRGLYYKPSSEDGSTILARLLAICEALEHGLGFGV